MQPSTVKQFGIGASLDYRELGEYLAGKGYMRQDILDSGVMIEDKNGRLIDAQAERLIFPIINNMDEVIGFGGRFLGKTDFAKYKNTKETMLFNKRNTLYNINLLKTPAFFCCRREGLFCTMCRDRCCSNPDRNSRPKQRRCPNSCRRQDILGCRRNELPSSRRDCRR